MTSPLLRLPIELRLRIYHCYAVNITRVFVRDEKAEDEHWRSTSKDVLKYQLSTAQLMLVNKEIYHEYKDEAKRLTYSLFEVPVTANTCYLSPATAENYELPLDKKFNVDAVQFILGFTGGYSGQDGGDRYDWDKQLLTQQLEYIASFLKLCNGVTKLRCRIWLTDDWRNDYYYKLCDMCKHFFDSQIRIGHATTLEYVSRR
jgi:hypothetical protein